MQPIMVLAGTQAEALKMIPVYKSLKNNGLPALLCAIKSDYDLQDVASLFDVKTDIILQNNTFSNDLFQITQDILKQTQELLTKINPSLVLVQGDSTESFASALAAFYLHIPLAHIEAGTRIGDIHSPFPGDFNRTMISLIATYHFAPSQAAAAQLLSQGLRRNTIFCTGNTMFDTLSHIKQAISDNQDLVSSKTKDDLMRLKAHSKKIVLCYYRNQDQSDFKKFNEILQQISADNTFQLINIEDNTHLSAADLIYVLSNIDIVATNISIIQEQAVGLGKHVLILKDKADRFEGVWSGMTFVTGLHIEKIQDALHAIRFESWKKSAQSKYTLYGDGHASERIAMIIADELGYSAHYVKRFEKELR